LFLDNFADQVSAENLFAGELALKQVCHELIVTVGVDPEASSNSGGLDGGVIRINVVFGETTELHSRCSPAADLSWRDGSEV
jgi:hypothetical protein